MKLRLEDYETDPCVLVEVVWESTKTIDLGENCSLQTHLVVDTEAMTIGHLLCLGGSIELVDGYRNIFQ